MKMKMEMKAFAAAISLMAAPVQAAQVEQAACRFNISVAHKGQTLVYRDSLTRITPDADCAALAESAIKPAWGSAAALIEAKITKVNWAKLPLYTWKGEPKIEDLGNCSFLVAGIMPDGRPVLRRETVVRQSQADGCAPAMAQIAKMWKETLGKARGGAGYQGIINGGMTPYYSEEE
jgi:hypothetical protein